MMKTARYILILTLFILPYEVTANTLNVCLLKQIELADDTQTIGEIKNLCQTQTSTIEAGATSAITQRVTYERAYSQNPFSLLPHKPNYILLSNNLASPHEDPFEMAYPERDVNFQPWETKFQISLKVPVIRNLFDGKGDVYMAYTNRSFWQQFNKQGSSPFRDSNHEPELWLSYKNDTRVFGFTNSVIRTGISHQSNGQSGQLSRSWNRLYTEFIFEKEDLYVSLKPWWRLPESNDKDDNPDIETYMGHFELGLLYKYKQHSFDLMFRNNLHASNNYGAVQFGWSLPITKNIRGYLQWFNGYGESLIDYNAHTNSIGMGIQLTDWL
jgi:phospholipase A1